MRLSFLFILILASTNAYGIKGGVLFSSAPPLFTPYENSYSSPKRSIGINNIPGEWYGAIVHYSSSTGHHATYKLNVKIYNGYVVVIDFGNDGYVHAFSNNSGYKYKGGALDIDEDLYGNIVSATATVLVLYNNGDWQNFIIDVE